MRATVGGDRLMDVRLDLPLEVLEVIAQRAAEIIDDQRDEAAPSASRYLTVDEAAVYLRCKPKRIYDLCSQRRVTYFKDGSRTLLRPADLDAYLEGSS